MRVGRECDHDTVNPVLVHELADICRRREELERGPPFVTAPLAWSTKPTMLRPWLRCLPNFRASKRCYVVRIDSQHVFAHRAGNSDTNPIVTDQNTMSRSIVGCATCVPARKIQVPIVTRLQHAEEVVHRRNDPFALRRDRGDRRVGRGSPTTTGRRRKGLTSIRRIDSILANLGWPIVRATCVASCARRCASRAAPRSGSR